MRSLMRILLISAIFFSFTGCFTEDSTSSSSTSSTSSTGGSDDGTATLRVVNSSSYYVYYLYVSLATASDWGSDQLGTSTIPSGSTFNLTGIPAGTYDFCAETSAAYDLSWEYYGAVLTSGMTFTWTLTNKKISEKGMESFEEVDTLDENLVSDSVFQ